MQVDIKSKEYKKVLKNYNFIDEDCKKLLEIKELCFKYEEKLLEQFYEFIFRFDYAKSFLHSDDILQRHKKGISGWYKSLFCGKYDENYFYRLNQISEIHVQIGLPAHYVNAAFSFIRSFLKEVLIKHKAFEGLNSLDKIIDINLDFLTTSYKDEEQSKLIDEILFLKSVVESKNIKPFVQGIYDSKTLNLEKYECLMRLKSLNQKEYLSVFPYLNTSKKIKVYKKMMEQMIVKSLALLENKKIEFSLNLSYEDINDKEFREFLYERIKNFKNPRRIIFEILETDFIEDFLVVKSFTKKVREFGCKIAIDDFGSGYSNMENIIKLKPDIIKIDGSLIKNISSEKESKTIVKNIINMSKELNAKSVAEYVYNKEILEIVQDLGVDFVQGFYLEKPKEIK